MQCVNLEWIWSREGEWITNSSGRWFWNNLVNLNIEYMLDEIIELMLIFLRCDNVEDFLRRCILKYLGVKYPHISVLLLNGSAKRERERVCVSCVCACMHACVWKKSSVEINSNLWIWVKDMWLLVLFLQLLCGFEISVVWKLEKHFFLKPLKIYSEIEQVVLGQLDPQIWGC